ncbi:MAG TPA: carbohydrate-binding domain-containing protein, partial [Alphaproteobacteria bacterium]|nr:carbohydrate-binding domain-containing protein [Alphaproteobacteria bacterium]
TPTGTGTGPDTVTVRVAEDAYNGDAQFVVKVDGQQIGGLQTATASHGNGQWQDVTLNGTFGTGPHQVDVLYINDAWGGSTSADRNLYIQSVTVNGQTTSTPTANNAANGAQPADGSTEMAINGTASYATTGTGSTGGTTTPTDPTGSTGGTTTPTTSGLTVHVAEDAWNGDAQFKVLVDGQQVGGNYTATGSHAAGAWQDVAIGGTFAAGPHDVAIQFINDAWGGSATTDRNLYVQSITLNGESISAPTSNTGANGAHPADGSAELAVNGTATYHATGTTTDTSGGTTTPTGSTGGTTTPTPSPLHVMVSEDAYAGDAQFTVSVDGQQVGGTYTATGSHAAGAWQDVAIDGTFAAGPHNVTVNFVNDAWGGSAATDRNLYVQSISLNGETVSAPTSNTGANSTHPADGSAELAINGGVTYHATGTTTDTSGTTTGTTGGTTTTSTLSTIVLHVAEDAWSGDAQFKVLVDGQQVGGTYTTTASHAAGQWQDITLTGDFGSTGPGKVDIQFTNDAWGGNANADRNLYVQSIDVNSHNFAASTATNTAANGAHPADGSAELAINGTLDFNVNHTAPVSDYHLV